MSYIIVLYILYIIYYYYVCIYIAGISDDLILDLNVQQLLGDGSSTDADVSQGEMGEKEYRRGCTWRSEKTAGRKSRIPMKMTRCNGQEQTESGG